MTKPTFDRKRPLSWSAISSFEYDKEQWYRKYVLGQEDPASKEMLFGSKVGRDIAEARVHMPHIKRYPVFEYELKFMFGKIPMIGYLDGWDAIHLDLGEYKTGKKPWTQKRADEHGQFDTYGLGLWIQDKVRPEDVTFNLHWMPTQDNGDFSISFIDPTVCHNFVTYRSMGDILEFGARINRVYKEMDQYCKHHE